MADSTMDSKAINYKNIPVQSDIISGIIRLDVESTTCFRELDGLVRSDQGVASLVLRVVNSSLYSRGKQIATIPLAISVLGFNVVRSLAMLAFSRSLFSQTKDPLFKRHIWQHSLLTAIAGQAVCQSLNQAGAKDEAFIAGLMHDTGKVLLFTHDKERYLQALTHSLETGCTSLEAEQRFFGVDHCEVGREAVAQWKLPERFIDYMAVDLNVPRQEYAADAVRMSLATANCLIKGIGLGAKMIEDADIRRGQLEAFGLNESLCNSLLEESFVESLIENDVYKLSANL